MPETKTVRCVFCPCEKDSTEGCICYCHSTKQDLQFELPESQWNATEAEVLSIVDSERSDSV